LDLRVYALDTDGYMRPSQRGVAISCTNIFELISSSRTRSAKMTQLGIINAEKPK
jgi:hypothetical protein